MQTIEKIDKKYTKRLYEYSTKKRFVGSLECKEKPNLYKMSTPDKIVELAKKLGIADECQEVLIAVLLGTKNNLIGYSEVSRGLIDRCHAHSREVFRQAITQNAAKIVLLHNHPSGDCTPSPADVRVTKELIKAGKIIEIEVVDHIIVSQTDEFNHYSLKDYGWL